MKLADNLNELYRSICPSFFATWKACSAMLALILVKAPVLFLLLLSFTVYVTSGNGHSLDNKDFCVAAVDLQRAARANETAVQDCCDPFLLGGRTGVYWYRSLGRSHRAFCDMTTAGGGWLVILRRLKEWPKPNDSTDRRYFERTYNPDDQKGDYQQGFGSLDQNFWFGLKKLYKLTNRSKVYAQARFEFTEKHTGNEYWVEYDTFSVASDYTLTIGNYTGGNLQDIFSVLDGWIFKSGYSCGTHSWWWYHRKERHCRCLDPFMTRHSSAVSRSKGACLQGPSNNPANNEIIIETMEIKIRFKRYPCPHHVRSTT